MIKVCLNYNYCARENSDNTARSNTNEYTLKRLITDNKHILFGQPTHQ